jgi:uncharacterized membrane protein YdjX (TVP38/TMEM64 family)
MPDCPTEGVPSDRHHELTSSPALRRAVPWSRWWPSVRDGCAVVVLFGAAIWLTDHFDSTIRDLLTANVVLAFATLFLTSVVAVLLPVLSNLALLPGFVLVWGPGWTALVLLAGWIVGAALSFTLGRRARSAILRVFPSVKRHADIDRLIHPRHRMISLVMLRMTFPVDVLSYALGLFSARTTVAENVLSTTLGAAPFALLFSLLPSLSGTDQLMVFAGSALLFVLYAAWILHRGPGRAHW